MAVETATGENEVSVRIRWMGGKGVNMGQADVNSIDGKDNTQNSPLSARPTPTATLAMAHGPDFPNTTDWPQSLIDALAQAAQTDRGIYHLDANGAETFQSYQQLWQDAHTIATNLQASGLESGTCVVLQLLQNADVLTAFWGCVLGGYVPVPISAHAPDPSVPLQAAFQLLDDAALISNRPTQLEGSDNVFSYDELSKIQASASSAAVLESKLSPPSCAPDDLALLLLTSGSTGTPKGVMLSHQNLRASAYGMAIANHLTSDDITFNWMPLEHVASLVMFHLTEVYLGCTQIHAPSELVLKDPLAWLDVCDRYRVTATWAPNFAYGLVNEKVEALEKDGKWDLSCLRWMGNGAEAVVGTTTRRFLQLLAPYGLAPTAVSPGYGMSETCSGIVHSHQFCLDSTSDDDALVTVGQPIPGTALRIVNDTNQVLPQRDVGQLQVKGLTVMQGYYQRPDLNAEVFTADGWFDKTDGKINSFVPDSPISEQYSR